MSVFLLLGAIVLSGCRSVHHGEPIEVAQVLRAWTPAPPSEAEETIVEPIGFRMTEWNRLCVELAVESPVPDDDIPILLPFLLWHDGEKWLEITKPNGQALTLRKPKPTVGCWFGPPIESYSIALEDGRRRIYMSCMLSIGTFENLPNGTYRIRLIDNGLESARSRYRIDSAWHEVSIVRATLIEVPDEERPVRPRMQSKGIAR